MAQINLLRLVQFMNILKYVGKLGLDINPSYRKKILT